MSDLICRKTMMRCMTPGMCSPFGGCRDTSYDAIVAGLRAQVEQLTAERDQWQLEAIRLASAVCALGKMEFDQLTDDSKLIEVMSIIREAIQERDTLRAEVERLKQDAELEMVIQRAASELPDGWEIRICVERGAGWVELTNPDGEGIADEWSGQERLSGEVSDAIDAALEASR